MAIVPPDAPHGWVIYYKDMPMQGAYIVDYLRSPFTPARRGALAGTRPDDLAAALVAALMARHDFHAAEIEDLILGCAFPEGEQGLNIGRCVALQAGLPDSVAGSTINRWCGSSLQAIQMAAGAIATNSGDMFLSGGVESMSRIPMMGANPAPNPNWPAERQAAILNMGLTAENLANQYGIRREDQDSFALASQVKALEARAVGMFSDEILPFPTADHDGCPRDTGMTKMAELAPVFHESGSVTAGNSSPLTDGATMTLICSERALERHGLTPLARIAGFAVSGCDPAVMGIGPVLATRKALQRAGLSLGQMDVIEMNEAFAVQVLACCHDLDLDPAALNMDGGAIALGHPLGATGARLVGKAAQLLQRGGYRHALATQCIGGGQGIAMVLEAA